MPNYIVSRYECVSTQRPVNDNAFLIRKHSILIIHLREREKHIGCVMNGRVMDIKSNICTDKQHAYVNLLAALVSNAISRFQVLTHV